MAASGRATLSMYSINSCAELISRIVREAEAIIRERFEAMLSGGKRQAAE